MSVWYGMSTSGTAHKRRVLWRGQCRVYWQNEVNKFPPMSDFFLPVFISTAIRRVGEQIRCTSTVNNNKLYSGLAD